MKFYDRTKEIERLAKIRDFAFNNHSQMTVLTGRRRIGKTKLILKSCEGTPTVYLFVSRNSEAALCQKFVTVVRKTLDVFIPDGVSSFVSLFEVLMNVGKSKAFNLVIDEFQEFFYINPAVYSGMQDVWDRYKDVARVNFIASGSVFTLMHRIFLEYREPLYGRCDCIIKLQPFTTETLKEIMRDYNPNYVNDDLLALYTFTGGVPKYVELLLDRGCFTMQDMVNCIIQEDSIFIEEGNILLIQEFGKKYGSYYSILSAIASGRNTPAEISAALGGVSVGGLLQRLETDYDAVVRRRPILAKEGSQTVRYEIADNFLKFWFRYVVKNQDLVQSGLFDVLVATVVDDYPAYSGLVLEQYFRDKLRESGLYRNVGSWWNTQKGKGTAQNEIDIVAISADNKDVFIAEVKRQRKSFKPELLDEKVEAIRTKLFFKKRISTACLTLDDM